MCVNPQFSRAYGATGSGGGDSEGTISDSENSTTGDPDNDIIDSVENTARSGAGSSSADSTADSRDWKASEGRGGEGGSDGYSDFFFRSEMPFPSRRWLGYGNLTLWGDRETESEHVLRVLV